MEKWRIDRDFLSNKPIRTIDFCLEGEGEKSRDSSRMEIFSFSKIIFFAKEKNKKYLPLKTYFFLLKLYIFISFFFFFLRLLDVIFAILRWI